MSVYSRESTIVFLNPLLFSFFLCVFLFFHLEEMQGFSSSAESETKRCEIDSSAFCWRFRKCGNVFTFFFFSSFSCFVMFFWLRIPHTGHKKGGGCHRCGVWNVCLC